MQLYVIGRVIGCFGVSGCVKVQPITHSLHRFEHLKNVSLGVSEEQSLPYEIEDVRITDETVFIKFSTVNNRSLAEDCKGKFLFVTEDKAIQPRVGSYFIHDIVGCSVWSNDDKFLGTVIDVIKLSAYDLWEIRTGHKDYFIPAVKNFIEQVDVSNKRITIRVLEGLIEE